MTAPNFYRCDDGHCCSSLGYCGPDFDGVGYVNYDEPNVNGGYYLTAQAAYAAYCNNAQGGWRVGTCPNTNADTTTTTTTSTSTSTSTTTSTTSQGSTTTSMPTSNPTITPTTAPFEFDNLSYAFGQNQLISLSIILSVLFSLYFMSF